MEELSERRAIIPGQITVDRRCGTELHILAEVVHARLAEATNKSPSQYRSIYPHFRKIGSGVDDSIILNPFYGSIPIATGENPLHNPHITGSGPATLPNLQFFRTDDAKLSVLCRFLFEKFSRGHFPAKPAGHSWLYGDPVPHLARS
jgi:hypothetical protein